MSYLDELRDEVLAEPGAEERMESIRNTMRRELALEELRRSRHVTQAELAAVLGVSQTRVSRLEKQESAKFETYRQYVEALGGRLETVAVFGDERIPVRLDG